MQNQTTPPVLPDLSSARRSFSRLGWALVLFTVVSTLISYGIYYAALEFAPYIITKDWFLWVYALAPMYVVGVPIFIAVVSKIPKSRPEPKKLGLNGWFAFLLISFTLLYVGNYIGNILMMLVSSATGNEIANPVSEMLSGSSFWLNALMTAVIAPIVEELLFRKLFLDRTRVWGEKTAMILSALLFGLFHGNFYQFFYAFGIGLLLAYVYLRTGKLRHIITIHMVINGFCGVLPSWILANLPEDFFVKFSDPEFLESVAASEEAMLEFGEQMMPYILPLALYVVYAVGLVLAAIGGLAVYLIYRKKLKLQRSETDIPREYIGGAVYGAPGVIAAIALCVLLIAINLVAG